MATWMRHRATILVLFLMALAAVAITDWRFSYGRALVGVASTGATDLALASDRLTAQLQRYQELAVLMAEHPDLLSLAEGGGDAAAASALLLQAADKTAALDAIYVAADGRILASAHAPQGNVDQIAQSPHYQRALQGALGTHHALDARYDSRAFYFAAPSFAKDGPVSAVLIVVVDVESFEDNWRGEGPAVFFVDRLGDVFVTNRSELLFWKRTPQTQGLVPPSGSAPAFSATQERDYELWEMDWGPYLPKHGLHITQDLPKYALTGEAVLDLAPARRLAFLEAAVVTSTLLVFGLILWVTIERRRVLAEANAVLEERVSTRTRALSETNKMLRREIAERQEAEAALNKAQADLVQAGKLSALGQMSAGISHELNQPLMAIQSFAENGTRFLERGNESKAGDNLGRISQMATRMARIIKNLRAFARNESEPMGKVDVVAVINQAVELTEARLRNDAVILHWDPAQVPVAVYALGGEVRLGQVFVNLINNAADAMVGRETREITIDVQAGARLIVTVQDTGPGIDEPDKIFDPFYSTKEVGSSEGMGLGLSISYGLVQSFGGNIRGMNAPGGGAVFMVELERWQEEQVA